MKIKQQVPPMPIIQIIFVYLSMAMTNKDRNTNHVADKLLVLCIKTILSLKKKTNYVIGNFTGEQIFSYYFVYNVNLTYKV